MPVPTRSPARPVTFALAVAAALDGPVLWIHPAWTFPSACWATASGALVDPGRLVFARGRTATALLSAAEEALRTGLVPLVVAELPEAPALTPVRRLHLAAEAGAARGIPPLMLLLTPAEGGAPGVETRWHLAPVPGWTRDGRPRWRLARARARMAPEAIWETLSAGRLSPVPTTGSPLRH